MASYVCHRCNLIVEGDGKQVQGCPLCDPRLVMVEKKRHQPILCPLSIGTSSIWRL